MGDENHGAGGLHGLMGGHKGESSAVRGSKVKCKESLDEEMGKPREWAMEVYKGKESTATLDGEEDDILELNLEEEE
jgi:hypothetical protein